MQVADICTRRVMQATPSTLIVEAAKLMRQHQVGALVIVSATGTPRPLGVLTDRDIAVNVVACGKDPALTRVDDVMSRSVVTCRAEDSLFNVTRLMRGRGVRRIPVVDDEGLLAGIVSTEDVTNGLAEQLVALSRAVVYAPSHGNAAQGE